MQISYSRGGRSSISSSSLSVDSAPAPAEVAPTRAFASISSSFPCATSALPLPLLKHSLHTPLSLPLPSSASSVACFHSTLTAALCVLSLQRLPGATNGRCRRAAPSVRRTRRSHPPPRRELTFLHRSTGARRSVGFKPETSLLLLLSLLSFPRWASRLRADRPRPSARPCMPLIQGAAAPSALLLLRRRLLSSSSSLSRVRVSSSPEVSSTASARARVEGGRALLCVLVPDEERTRE